MSDQTDKEVTPAQLAANRANAQLSKGPTTEEGKRRSSMNALKSGLRANTVVLPDENPQDFEAFRERLYQALDPQDALQEALVESIIVDMWRARRGPRVEADLHRHAVRRFADEKARNEESVDAITAVSRMFDEEVRAAAAAKSGVANDAADDSMRTGLAFARISDPLMKHARYEEIINRRVLRNLHELQRLKAADAGVIVPAPQAVDIVADVDVKHEIDS
jgi:hypothetical protein